VSEPLRRSRFGLAFAAGTAAAVGLGVWWWDGSRSAFGGNPARDALANAGEVVAAVLAIAITVVAIVVELASNRYSHRITQHFVRDPVNLAVIGSFVLATFACFWLSAWPARDAPEPAAVAATLGLVGLTLLGLLPYFGYVFAFLQPTSIVARVRDGAVRLVRRAARRGRLDLRGDVVAAVEEIEEIAHGAVEHKDRSIALACVEALYGFLVEYRGLRAELPAGWFRIDGPLRSDPDFVAMESDLVAELERNGTWLETKVLDGLHGLFADGLHRMRSVSYVTALKTRELALDALRGGRRGELELLLRFFNSFLRSALNARDLRTAYYLLLHYRRVAEDALAAGDADAALAVAGHLRHYGQLAYGAELPFLLEVVSYDLAHVCEVAFELGSPAADRLLGLVLLVDREGESEAQESSLLGVRRAQVRLATFFLARGDRARARRIFEDLRAERPARIAAVRAELCADQPAQYWEMTERGANFAYLPPERKAQLGEFFGWFAGAREVG
jgi:hypothetical protein